MAAHRTAGGEIHAGWIPQISEAARPASGGETAKKRA
jgi:hypothetical protein